MIDLKAIRELVAETTPGVWKTWAMSVMADQAGDSDVSKAVLVCDTHYRNAQGRPRGNDADFIAQAHQLVPQLLELVDETVGALLRAEWGGYYDNGCYDCCVSCGGIAPSAAEDGAAPADVRQGNNVLGHTANCRLDAALTRAGLPDQTGRDAERARWVRGAART